MKKNILIIGGTNEGNSLANLLKSININYTISFAGRVKFIKNNSLNSRIGGFGGASKLLEWIINNKISHVVDASHPFASVISLNVFNVCISKKIPLFLPLGIPKGFPFGILSGRLQRSTLRSREGDIYSSPTTRHVLLPQEDISHVSRPYI